MNVPELRFSEFADEWKRILLNEISDRVMYGMNSAAISYDGENKYLRITDINENTRKFTPNPLTSPDGEIEDKYRLKEGDIVFARTGASVGKSYLFNKKDGNLFFAGFLIKFSITKGNPFFIFTQTLRDNYNKWVQLMSMRSGQPGINAEEYKSFSFLIPSLSEQQKIAIFLTSVDDKLTQLKKKKTLLEQYKKGVMQKIFTQELRFKDNNGLHFEVWMEKRLGDIAEIKGGKRIPKGVALEDKNNGFPYITVSDMENSTVSLSNIRYVPLSVVEKIKNYRILTTDIYISVAGTLGLVGIIPPELENANLTENANKITNLRCHQKFLLQFLKSDALKKLVENVGTVGAQPKLAIYAITDFKVPLPVIQEQTKIANFLSALDDKINHCQRQIEKTELWKKGLLQKMFV